MRFALPRHKRRVSVPRKMRRRGRRRIRPHFGSFFIILYPSSKPPLAVRLAVDRRLLCHVHQIHSIIEYPRDTRGAAERCRYPPAKRLVLTYSSRIYLERREPGDRTAPSRYFPFYDSSTYDAFKPERSNCTLSPFSGNSSGVRIVGAFSQFPDIMPRRIMSRINGLEKSIAASTCLCFTSVIRTADPNRPPGIIIRRRDDV